MTTVVLARKYRPKRFDQMVGQDHVVRALSNALQNNRLHHAYLFTGTRGIGKTTVSRILAKSLNCTGPDGQGGVTTEPCGVCTACTEIDADRYIDYIELDAASNRGIAEVQDLIERAAYKPGVGRYKVFMIDEAHQLTKDAFNALLKTLEEPPEYLKFVLATTDPEKMLPTVLSRCLQFNLRPMPPEVVREHLAQVLQAEGVPHDDGALRLLGRAARGSMRDALSLTDQAIAYGAGRLDEPVVRTMLGAVDRGHAVALVQALAARDGAAVLAVIDRLRDQGLDPSGTLDELAALLQQMAVAQLVPGALDAADPDQQPALQLAPLLAADETQLLYTLALHGRSELALCSDEYAALTMVLLRFLAFPPDGGGRPDVPPRAAPGPAAPAASPAAATLATRPAAVPAPRSAAAPAPRPAVAPAPPPRPQPPAPVPAARANPAPASDVPPWLDDGPPPDFDDGAGQAEPRHAPLRSPAPPSLVVPAAAAGAAAPAAPETSALGDRWAAVVTALAEQGRISALVRELAWQAGVRAFDAQSDGDRWTLVVERESLRAGATPDKLAAALTEAAGRPQQLQIEAGVPADSVSRREAWQRHCRQVEAEQVIRDDPSVQELLAQFKTARIVPGSIKPI